MRKFAGIVRILSQFNDALLRICRLTALVFIGVMTLVILLQVFFRYVLNAPLSWPEEAARYLMVWMTFLYKASLHPSFAQMNAELIGGWLARIASLLREARSSGELGDEMDVDREAMAIWAFSSGIGQIGLLQPESLPPTLQKQLVVDYLARLRSHCPGPTVEVTPKIELTSKI